MEREKSSEDDSNLMMVNIWRKVGGDLKLTNQKPVTKTEFEQMQTKKDFSTLL